MLSCYFRALRLGGVLTSPQAYAFGLANDSTKPSGHGKSRKARLSRLYSYNTKLKLTHILFVSVFVDLVLSIFKVNPELRPTATDILYHPYFWSDERVLNFYQVVTLSNIELTTSSTLTFAQFPKLIVNLQQHN